MSFSLHDNFEAGQPVEAMLQTFLMSSCDLDVLYGILSNPILLSYILFCASFALISFYAITDHESPKSVYFTIYSCFPSVVSFFMMLFLLYSDRIFKFLTAYPTIYFLLHPFTFIGKFSPSLTLHYFPSGLYCSALGYYYFLLFFVYGFVIPKKDPSFQLFVGFPLIMFICLVWFCIVSCSSFYLKFINIFESAAVFMLCQFYLPTIVRLFTFTYFTHVEYRSFRHYLDFVLYYCFFAVILHYSNYMMAFMFSSFIVLIPSFYYRYRHLCLADLDKLSRLQYLSDSFKPFICEFPPDNCSYVAKFLEYVLVYDPLFTSKDIVVHGSKYGISHLSKDKPYWSYCLVSSEWTAKNSLPSEFCSIVDKGYLYIEEFSLVNDVAADYVPQSTPKQLYVSGTNYLLDPLVHSFTFFTYLKLFNKFCVLSDTPFLAQDSSYLTCIRIVLSWFAMAYRLSYWKIVKEHNVSFLGTMGWLSICFNTNSTVFRHFLRICRSMFKVDFSLLPDKPRPFSKICMTDIVSRVIKTFLEKLPNDVATSRMLVVLSVLTCTPSVQAFPDSSFVYNRLCFDSIFSFIFLLFLSLFLTAFVSSTLKYSVPSRRFLFFSVLMMTSSVDCYNDYNPRNKTPGITFWFLISILGGLGKIIYDNWDLVTEFKLRMKRKNNPHPDWKKDDDNIPSCPFDVEFQSGFSGGVLDALTVVSNNSFLKMVWGFFSKKPFSPEYALSVLYFISSMSTAILVLFFSRSKVCRCSAWPTVVLGIIRIITELDPELLGSIQNDLFGEEFSLQSAQDDMMRPPRWLLDIGKAQDGIMNYYKPEILSPFFACWTVWSLYILSFTGETGKKKNWHTLYVDILAQLRKSHNIKGLDSLVISLLSSIRTMLWWVVMGSGCSNSTLRLEREYYSLASKYEVVRDSSYLETYEHPTRFLNEVLEDIKQFKQSARSRVYNDDHDNDAKTVARMTQISVLVDTMRRNIENRLKGSSTRPAPFTIFLYGEPGVGKSFMTTAVAQIIHSVSGSKMPLTITSLTDGDKYDSGWTNETTCGMMDDIMQSCTTNIQRQEVTMRLFRVNSSLNTKALMPEASDKGNITFNNNSLIITSNHVDGRVGDLGSDYGAVMRRLGIFWQVELKPDKGRTHGGIRQFDPADIIDGELIPSCLTFTKYENVQGESSKRHIIKEKISNVEFIEILKNDAREHYTTQRRCTTISKGRNYICTSCGGTLYKDLHTCVCKIKKPVVKSFWGSPVCVQEMSLGLETDPNGLITSDIFDVQSWDEYFCDNIPRNWFSKTLLTLLIFIKYVIIDRISHLAFYSVLCSRRCYHLSVSYCVIFIVTFWQAFTIFTCPCFLFYAFTAVCSLFVTTFNPTVLMPRTTTGLERLGVRGTIISFMSDYRQSFFHAIYLLLGIKLIHSVAARYMTKRIEIVLQASVDEKEKEVLRVAVPGDKPWRAKPIRVKHFSTSVLANTSSVSHIVEKLRENTFSIQMRPVDQTTYMKSKCVVANSNMVVTTGHGVQRMFETYPSATLFEVIYTFVQGGVVHTCNNTICKNNIYVSESKDLAWIYDCPVSKPKIDIKNFLLKEDFISPQPQSAMWIRYNVDSEENFSMPITVRQSTRDNKSIYGFNSPGQYNLIQTGGYNTSQTFNGLCGTPVFLQDSPRCIIGLHAFVNNSKDAIFDNAGGLVPISLKDYNDASKRFNRSYLHSLEDNGPNTTRCNTGVVIDHEAKNVHPKSYFNFLGYPTSLCGTTASTHNDKGRVEKMPCWYFFSSLFKDFVDFSVGRELNPTRVHRSFATRSSLTTSPDCQFLERASLDFQKPMQKCYDDFLTKIGEIVPLSEDDVCNSGNVYGLNSMNFSSSAGFGMKGQKKDYFEELVDEHGVLTGRKCFSDELKAGISQIIMDYSLGVSPGRVYKSAIKVEPGKLDDNGNKKLARLFQVPDVFMATFWKMFFGPLASFFTRYHIYFGNALGIDITSSECHNTFEEFLRYEEGMNPAKSYWMCDYKSFDTCHMPNMIACAGKAIVAPYALSGNMANYSIALSMLSDVVSSYIQTKNTILSPRAFLPSGIYITSLYNSVANSLLVRASFYKAYSDAGYDITDMDFSDYCISITFGDDGVHRMTNKNDDTIWNPQVFSNHCSEWGYKATNPIDKTKPCSYCSVRDLEFLSRKFRIHPVKNHVVGVLKPESLMKMVTVCIRNKNVSVTENMLACFENFLLEVSNYNEDTYLKAQSYVALICSALGIPMSGNMTLTYEDRHVKRFGVVPEYYVPIPIPDEDLFLDDISIFMYQIEQVHKVSQEQAMGWTDYSNSVSYSIDTPNQVDFQAELTDTLADAEEIKSGTFELKAPVSISVNNHSVPFNPPSNDDVTGLGSWLDRPYLLKQYAMPAGQSVTYLFDPFFSILKEKMFLARVNNHAFIRFNVMLKFHIITTKEMYGAFGISYHPLLKRTALYPSKNSKIDTITDSTLFHHIVDISHAGTVELEIPYIWPFQMIQRIEAGFKEGDFGFLQIRTLAPLRNTSQAFSGTVSVQIYGTVSNLVLGGPTSVNFQSFPDEKLSATLGKASALAGMASTLLTGTGAQLPSELVSKGLGVAAGVAAKFGYSKPRQMDYTEYLGYGTVAYAGNGMGKVNSRMLSVDPYHETAINTVAGGIGFGDSLTAEYLSAVRTIVSVFTITSSSKIGEKLWSIPVNPGYTYNEGKFFAIPASSAYALNFNFWHGGAMCYEFTIVKHPSHGGVLSIVHDPLPVGDASVTSTKMMKIDLRTDDSVTVKVNWATNKPALIVSYPTPGTPLDMHCCNGYLNCYVDSPITSTGTSPASITIIVKMWWENISFYSPTTSYWNNFDIWEPESKTQAEPTRFFKIFNNNYNFNYSTTSTTTISNNLPVPPINNFPPFLIDDFGVTNTDAERIFTPNILIENPSLPGFNVAVKSVSPVGLGMVLCTYPACLVYVKGGPPIPDGAYSAGGSVISFTDKVSSYIVNASVWSESGRVRMCVVAKGTCEVFLFKSVDVNSLKATLGTLRGNDLNMPNGIQIDVVDFILPDAKRGFVNVLLQLDFKPGSVPAMFTFIGIRSVSPQWVKHVDLSFNAIRTYPSVANFDTLYDSKAYGLSGTLSTIKVGYGASRSMLITIPATELVSLMEIPSARISISHMNPIAWTNGNISGTFPGNKDYVVVSSLIPVGAVTFTNLVGSAISGVAYMSFIAPDGPILQSEFNVSGNNINHTLTDRQMAGELNCSVRPLLKVMQDPIYQTIPPGEVWHCNSFSNQGIKRATPFNIFTLSHLAVSGSVCFMIELIAGGPILVSARDPSGSTSVLNFEVLRQGGQNLFVYEVPYYGRENFMVPRGCFTKVNVWGPNTDMSNVGLNSVGMQLINYSSSEAKIKTWVSAGESYSLSGFLHIPLLVRKSTESVI